MKNLYNNVSNKVVLAVLGLFAVTGIVSCDTTGLTDTLDDFGVVVELEPINTTSSVLIYDAVSGELVTSTVTINYGGENGDDVIDVYSDPIDQSSVSDGILGFGIDNSVTPSESDPATIQLIFEADGYESRARTVTIVESGSNEFEVELTPENENPEGVETASSTEGQADESGAVQQDFSVTANAETEDEGGTSVEVESGTVFKDANGNALKGQLTSEVTYYNPNDLSALKSIPVELSDEDDNPILVLGGTSVTIVDSKGNKAETAEVSAKSVSEHGATYVMVIPEGINNFYTQKPFKVGDNVLFFIFDNSFKKIRKDAAVIDLGNNRLGVRYNSTVVPRFTMLAQRMRSEDSCIAPLTITRNGNTGNILLEVFREGYYRNFPIKAGANRTASNYRISTGSYSVNARTSSSSMEINNKINVCNAEVVDLPEPPANLIDAQINLSLKCENPNYSIRATDLPGATVLYRKEGAVQGTKWAKATNVQFKTNNAGTALTGALADVQGVEQGSDYKFKVNFDGETYSKTINITGTTVNTDYIIDNNDVCVE